MLVYPLSEVPEDGVAVTVAPGVRWLRLPVGGRLSFINVWALDDRDEAGDGIALVDTGMGTDASAAAWQAAFAGPLAGQRVTRVFVTHMHPDHIGMAGPLTRAHACRLWISRLEFLTCHTLAADTGRAVPAEAVRFYRAAGWDAAMLADYAARFGMFGQLIRDLPGSFMRISDGDELAIGAHRWRVVVGSGHSPEHACLHCPELDLLISGDQVLPRISSNVALFPTEPEANPLADWLSSLARIKTLVPDSVLVLPAHNDPFLGLHERIDALLAEHRDSLAKLLAVLDAPQRAVDLFPLLFKRPIRGFDTFLATGEALAHLNYLRAEGSVVREADADGVDWYRTT